MSKGAVAEFVAGDHAGERGTVLAKGFPTRVGVVGGGEVSVYHAGEIVPVAPSGRTGERVRVIHGQLAHRTATVLFAKTVRHAGRDAAYAWLDVPSNRTGSCRSRGVRRSRRRTPSASPRTAPQSERRVPSRPVASQWASELD